MLVHVPQKLLSPKTIILGATESFNSRLNDRLYNPTNVVDPGQPAIDLQDLNDRSRLFLDDYNLNQNPDPVIYPSPELSATNTVRSGYTVPDLTGVVDYAFGNYKFQPVGPLVFSAENPRIESHESVDAESAFTSTLKVASFNVLNYFSTIDDGVNDICGPSEDMECRGADSAEEFTRQRTKIINAIIAMDADVIGLMEMENHVTDAALQDLVAGLNDPVRWQHLCHDRHRPDRHRRHQGGLYLQGGHGSALWRPCHP